MIEIIFKKTKIMELSDASAGWLIREFKRGGFRYRYDNDQIIIQGKRSYVKFVELKENGLL